MLFLWSLGCFFFPLQIELNFQAVWVISKEAFFFFFTPSVSLYHSLSLWVIRMHPGCLSACSLITQRETGPNTKYTVCPHLSTAHKVLLQQKTTQGHKWLISRATSWLRLIIVTPPIFKEHNKLLTIYLKLTVITNRILDNNNIYAGLHSCYIIMWVFF